MYELVPLQFRIVKEPFVASWDGTHVKLLGVSGLMFAEICRVIETFLAVFYRAIEDLVFLGIEHLVSVQRQLLGIQFWLALR